MTDEATKLCIYCGIREATDSEHVIGKVFYTRIPKIGITVPSCSSCNRGRADGGTRDLHLDEEYMRTILCMTEGAYNHPVANELLEGSVSRSMRRRKGRFRRSLVETISYTERKAAGGLFNPYSSPFIRPDFSRFQRVLRKITKGLYYRVTGRTLPENYLILVNPTVRPREVEVLLERFRSHGALEFQSADEYDVFRFMLFEIEECKTEWLMMFYKWAVFHTWTLPANEVAPGATGMPTFLTLEIY